MIKDWQVLLLKLLWMSLNPDLKEVKPVEKVWFSLTIGDVTFKASKESIKTIFMVLVVWGRRVLPCVASLLVGAAGTAGLNSQLPQQLPEENPAAPTVEDVCLNK